MQLKHLGIVVCLGAIAGSTLVAAMFGWSIGNSYGLLTACIFAVGGAVADLLKAMTPIFIGKRWDERNYAAVLAGALGFAVVTAYSLTSSFGLIASLQADRVGGHAAVVTTYNDRRVDLDRLLASRAEIKAKPTTEDAQAVAQAAVDQADSSVKAECADKQGPKCRGLEEIARTKRDELAAIVADLAVAKKAAEFDRKIEAAQAALAKVDLKEASREADPQAAALTRWVRRFVAAEQDLVSDAVHSLFALMMEFASGFGLLVVLGHHGKAEEPQTAKKPDVGNDEALGPLDVIERFRGERVRPAQGGRVAASEMHAAFCGWCTERGIEPVSTMQFGQLARWRKDKIGGRVWYLDLALAGKPALRVAVDNVA